MSDIDDIETRIRQDALSASDAEQFDFMYRDLDPIFRDYRRFLE